MVGVTAFNSTTLPVVSGGSADRGSGLAATTQSQAKLEAPQNLFHQQRCAPALYATGVERVLDRSDSNDNLSGVSGAGCVGAALHVKP